MVALNCVYPLLLLMIVLVVLDKVVGWVHQNNQTFKPTLKEAATAHYKFVVLRCSLRRLASVFWINL
tara:strand:- start:614 stop:814 length:201 start_codon:yes stop_codon:yes gene_type:complete